MSTLVWYIIPCASGRSCTGEPESELILRFTAVVEGLFSPTKFSYLLFFKGIFISGLTLNVNIPNMLFVIINFHAVGPVK